MQQPPESLRNTVNYPLIEQSQEWNAPGNLKESIRASLHACNTPLFDAFFSNHNIERIQTQLRIIIREKTGYTIDRQDVNQLVIIMRGMFAMHANPNAQDPDAETRRLNAYVLSEIVPMVGTGLSQYLGYLRDASQMHVPLERPKNMSIKGHNTFELFKN